MKKYIVTLCFITGIFSGCATISNSPSQKVTITASNGQSVIADINGKKVTLPAQIDVKRKGSTTIRVLNVDNPQYKDTMLVIEGEDKITGTFWLNFLSGFFFLLPGVTSTVVDSATGSMWSYTDPNFVVTLTPL